MGDIMITHAFDPQKRAGEVSIEDFVVAATDYDATGWAGLELLEQLAFNLAVYFGVPVTNRDMGGSGEDE